MFKSVQELKGGLTPAGAGSTSLEITRISPRRAYPRRCGEHDSVVYVGRWPQGLPPQVRGARARHREHTAATGLTPAGAGSTWGIGEE